MITDEQFDQIHYREWLRYEAYLNRRFELRKAYEDLLRHAQESMDMDTMDVCRDNWRVHNDVN